LTILRGPDAANLAKSPHDETREPQPIQGPAASRGYVVQLSSQRSGAAAQATAHALHLKHSTLFDGRQPFIRRSDLGSRGVYFRVLLGSFASVEQAKQVCGELKKLGGDCIVQKD
jgi:cell division septation protein DedD